MGAWLIAWGHEKISKQNEEIDNQFRRTVRASRSINKYMSLQQAFFICKWLLSWFSSYSIKLQMCLGEQKTPTPILHPLVLGCK